MNKKASHKQFAVVIPERSEITDYLKRAQAPRQLEQIAASFSLNSADEREVSYRLLRHYATSIRHQKYHGIDIFTVVVDPVAEPASPSPAA